MDCLPLFTSGRARLLDSKRLVSQFAALERRTSPIGKDRIDHEPGGHDDLCNAAAGALVLASQTKRPMTFAPPEIIPAANYFRSFDTGGRIPAGSFDSGGGPMSAPPGGWHNPANRR